jgi:hypothetical protein
LPCCYPVRLRAATRRIADAVVIASGAIKAQMIKPHSMSDKNWSL